MLTALDSSNKLILLTGIEDKNGLSRLREKEQFYCPQCQKAVHLKIGQVMIPHFAHRKKGSCQYFSEGETATHLLGKRHLYEMFQRLQIEAKLEPYLKSLMQRPDLLIKVEEQQYAIEFQYSTISKPQMVKRTTGYHKEKMIPLWILHTPTTKNPHKDGIQQIRLSPFKQQFITYSNQHAHLITYNPTLKLFVYYNYLLPIGGYRFIAKVQTLAIDQQHFPFLRASALTKNEYLKYWQLCKRERERVLRGRLHISKRGVKDPFLRACYYLRVIPEKLPLFVGIPINKKPHSIEAVEWQLLWLYFLYTQHQNCMAYSPKLAKDFTDSHGICLDTESIRFYSEILNYLDIEDIFSHYEEEKIFHYIYSQFLAKT
ncbi:competence protein CoiA [Rummeliibacillus sp. TYF-LIM-RU47]|uniref:competence protein CoiA n=1 Tax=Rummeliibacillus sp. TYF-LIM-RU47 TaxID=2608406 RepID=UPI001239D044|nr:competence protein CoiA family protein [Rummeliibacillus sp. TYF-LIM-RU47]